MQIVLDGKVAAERSVIAMGMFDGVHIGHQVLLRKAAALAKQAGCPLVVCTFQQHPMELLKPEDAPLMLSTLMERQQMMQALGADVFFAPVFDREAANMLPECYIGELVRRFHPVNVVCGYNHSYGKNGAGSAALLEVLGGALQFDTCIVPQITYQGQEVSSSIIRKHLQNGDAAMVRRMLGRPYSRKVTAKKENDGLKLFFDEDHKQPILQGTYRCALHNGEKNFPVLVNNADGSASVFHHQIPEGIYQLQYFC